MEELFAELRIPLTRRLQRMVGDHGVAEDLRQEAFARAWSSAPRGADRDHLRAWVHRTARNLAVDHLRRRSTRDLVPFADETIGSTPDPDPDARLAAREALDRLSPHERLLLLLRFEGGLSLAEIGALLEISEDAARKRVARAKAAFRDALNDAERDDDRPTVLVLMGDDDAEAYSRWLSASGARVRVMDLDRPGLDLAGADALVLSGSATDVHPRTYRAPRDPRSVRPDLHRDLRDLAAMRAALRDDVPMIGVCRGAQLLSVLFGGDLAQHVDGHAGDRPHVVATEAGSAIRGALGPRPEVVSDHHQAVRRLGRGLRVTALAPDGLPEAIEVPGRRLALGLQWHPERGGGRELADALVAAAAA